MMRRRFLRDTDGATAVETALISIVLFALTFGIIEFGRALYIKQALNFGAENAARLLYINPKAQPGELKSAVDASMFLVNKNDIKVTRSNPVPVSKTGFAKIRLIVTYNFESVVPSLVSKPILLSSDRDVLVSFTP